MRTKPHSKIKESAGSRVFDAFNTVFMAVLMLVTLYPFLYVTFASISDPTQMMRHTGVLLWPKGFGVDNYRLVFQNPMILRGYGNTLMYVVLGTVINLIMTIMAAFVVSRKNLMIKKPMIFMMMFTMYFSGGLIPSYLLVKGLNMLDTVWALVLPGAMSTYNMIIMRTSFMAIPESLEESAKLDGANDLTILLRIVVPLSIPTIAIMVLFYGVGHWNSWFSASIYLNAREKFPLQLILREILLSSSVDDMMTGLGMQDSIPVAETLKYATIMVATVPILCVYPFLQKYFVKGMMIGAVKG